MSAANGFFLHIVLVFNCLLRISSLNLPASPEHNWLWVSWHVWNGFGAAVFFSPFYTPVHFALRLYISRDVSRVSSSSEKQPWQNHYDIYLVKPYNFSPSVELYHTLYAWCKSSQIWIDFVPFPVHKWMFLVLDSSLYICWCLNFVICMQRKE